MTIKKRKRPISHGRPPSNKIKERMTSNRSRTIIRTHHQLQKERCAALKSGDTSAAAALSLAIEKNGGIKKYQAASKQGQARDRGGDSSKFLVNWLKTSQLIDTQARSGTGSNVALLSCLEIGALSTQNEISRYPSAISMTRIDLNSQGPGIEKQDFMERPLPTGKNECFDIIALSLVLNYVPDAAGRGEMLKRLTKFLRTSNHKADQPTSAFPLLFLVLPLPCIHNSRYFDENRLMQIMASLGFALQHSKSASKVSYYIFSWTGVLTDAKFPKIKITDGPSRNNFSVIIQ